MNKIFETRVAVQPQQTGHLVATAHQVNRAARKRQLGGAPSFPQLPQTVSLNPVIIEERIQKLVEPSCEELHEIVGWVIDESYALWCDFLVVCGKEMSSLSGEEVKQTIKDFISSAIKSVGVLVEKIPACQADPRLWESAKSRLMTCVRKLDEKKRISQEELLRWMEVSMRLTKQGAL